MQDCGTIQLLEPFLAAGRPAEGVAQALAALDNLCKISRCAVALVTMRACVGPCACNWHLLQEGLHTLHEGPHSAV